MSQHWRGNPRPFSSPSKDFCHPQKLPGAGFAGKRGVQRLVSPGVSRPPGDGGVVPRVGSGLLIAPFRALSWLRGVKDHTPGARPVNCGSPPGLTNPDIYAILSSRLVHESYNQTNTYKRCARDKPDDRTATSQRERCQSLYDRFIPVPRLVFLRLFFWEYREMRCFIVIRELL